MATAPKTVLAIETEVDPRRVVSSQLRSAGYEVLTAATTDAAYALLEEHREVDLLIADLLAPGTLNTADLTERSKALCPNIQILFTTDLRRLAQKTHDDTHEVSPMISIVRVLLGDGPQPPARQP